MITYFWYILKVSICLIALYTFYLLLLRNSTYFFLNRLYLVIGLFLSFIIPILKFSIFKQQSDSQLSSVLNKILIAPENDFFQTQNLSYGVTSINYSLILSVIYFTGISILFCKLLFSIVRINRIKNSSEIYQMGKLKIVKTDSAVPFSFFSLIFLPKTESNSMIIEHEKAHITQLHWFDLILTEIVSVLLWFNPFVVLYKSSLQLQHEYLADHKVIKNNNPIENYLGCLLKHVQIVSKGGLVSHFFCKTIKKRIDMITKNKTSVSYVGVYLLILPIICLLLFAFTSSNHKIVLISNDTVSVNSDEYIPSIFPVDVKIVKSTSGYGQRMNPFTNKKDFHYGIDIAISVGEKVRSTAKGIVVETGTDSIKGNYIIINHNKDFSTFYAKLKSVSVKVGDKIEKGEIIGYSGNTGISTGPHLHYEVIKNGKQVDPKDYLPK